MAKSLQLINNDLAIINNNFNEISGSDAIMQNIKTRLQTFLGEWFLDTSIGVPYLQEIMVKGTSTARVDSIIQETILGTDGVQELKTYNAEYDNENRLYTITFGVRVDGSEDIIQETIEV